MAFIGRRTFVQPTPPACPRAPEAPTAPRPGSSAPRPSSKRSVWSAASRISTSSQSTPEPDADIGEDDGAVYSSDDAALDAGWGRPQLGSPSSHIDSAGATAEALAAAENRIRALEKQIQTERRLRMGAEEALAQTRSKLSTPVQQVPAGRT